MLILKLITYYYYLSASFYKFILFKISLFRPYNPRYLLKKILTQKFGQKMVIFLLCIDLVHQQFLCLY